MEGGEVMKAAKDKVKAKAKSVKAKLHSKLKKSVKASVAIMAAILSLTLYEGCSTATPASRATTATYTFNFDFGEKAKNVSITNKMGDGALASADSSGSTETQTATPTLDVKPDINVNYAQGGGITNRGTGGASGAAGILESLTAEGLSALKAAISNKTTGKITLQKKDGTTVTADCKDGGCTFSDGTTVTAEDCANCPGGNCEYVP